MNTAYNTPRNRLALTYLMIIMVLSIGFSIIFYRESTHEAGAGFRRQATQMRDNLYFAPPGSIERIRDDGINRFNDNVLGRLIFLNTGMLLAGGFVSYYLAKRSLEPMEDALAAQTRFTSDAAHELRTPLTAMKTEIEVALRSKNLVEQEARTVLGSNLEEIAKLETLTDALLRLAKNGHQTDESSWKKVKLTDVLESASERVGAQAKESKIEIELPTASPLTLQADKDQLIELFVILFDNAITYGKPDTSIKVEALHNEERFVITVADHGIGIAEKDLPHIFERFYRADQSRNKKKITGYGLGLSVASAIVKSHNGSIEATSKIGDGTTFTVTLPRVK